MPGSARWPPGFASAPEDRAALLVLATLRGLTPRKLVELAAREGRAAACLQAVRDGRAGSAGDRAFARRLDPARLEVAVRACGARFVTAEDEEYPEGLSDLADPPAGLFVRGRPLGELGPRVAIVGARACTALGREVAEGLGRSLALAGACTVSGGARGIDSASHEGALAAEGATLAVLGSGIDRAFPPGSRTLLARVAASGALVSEYAPGVPAEPFRFPARNRLIAAMSEAVVVVEGREGSGSLITVEHALDLGRQVFAVPGSVTSPLSAAPLALIRDGAGCIRDGADLVADLGLDGLGAAIHPLRRPVTLAPDERAVWEALVERMLPEDVARRAGVPLPSAVAALTRLELHGLVRTVGGRVERRAAAAPEAASAAGRRA